MSERLNHTTPCERCGSQVPSWRDASKRWHAFSLCDDCLRAQTLADALVDAAQAFADHRDEADIDVIEAEGPILERLNVPLDQTEQGLTQQASDAVYGFARRHTSKPEVAARVFGPATPGEAERTDEDPRRAEYREQARDTFQAMSDEALRYQDGLVPRGGSSFACIDRQELDRELRERRSL